MGCGYGFFSREALRKGFEGVAIELASNERAIAERMTDLKPMRVSFEGFEVLTSRAALGGLKGGPKRGGSGLDVPAPPK